MSIQGSPTHIIPSKLASCQRNNAQCLTIIWHQQPTRCNRSQHIVFVPQVYVHSCPDNHITSVIDITTYFRSSKLPPTNHKIHFLDATSSFILRDSVQNYISRYDAPSSEEASPCGAASDSTSGKIF
mmetsp:Transcript_26890/g.64539  ORF Transcript_26890/g.64539 Transcript_26890/m.64539 type:complete len:127 (+) Transcript_26890:36-416(+)